MSEFDTNDDPRYALIGISINSMHNSYDTKTKSILNSYFNLPLEELMKSWKWFSDPVKLKILTTYKSTFDDWSMFILNKNSQK